MVFSIYKINRKISSLKRLELGNSSIDLGKSDMPITHIFQSSDRNLDVTAQYLSERWGISISTAANTLKKNAQEFLRSAVLLLSRRYRTDQVSTRKTLRGDWYTDTMDARCKKLEGNKYAPVFANKGFLSCIYPMY